jgi:YggT family protein
MATLMIQASILSSFHNSLLLILRLASFFTLVIIAGALLSWVSPDPYNPIVQAIYSISDPLLMPFRRVIPSLGGIDFSPIFAIIALQVAGHLGTELINTLFSYLSRAYF